jgi:hypothetical protein
MDKNIKKITPRELWYINNYKKEYLNFPTNNIIKKKFQDKKNDHLYLYGEYNRIETEIAFGYFLDINTVDTICLVFKIKDAIEDIDAIFSFGYFELYKKRINEKEGLDDIHGKSGFQLPGTSIKSRYFTLGPSYTSKDGEYRVGLISYSNIVTIKSTPIVQNIFQDIIAYINKISMDRGWMLLKEYFFPTDDKKITQNEIEYNSFQLQSELFALTWFNILFNVYLNFVENHINEKFKKIMFKYKKEDSVFFNALYLQYGKEKIELMRYMCNNVLNGRVSNQFFNKPLYKTKIGQKLIPLTIAESQNPFDIKYKPWREYLISIYLSNFIINNISPGFFIINSWFYIKNSRKGLYDNDIQYEKMHRSELAVQITELLSRAQIYTHENIGKGNLIKNNDINSYLSLKFKNLYDKIQKPITYAKEDIIMSNVTLAIMSEYVGRTLWDMILLTKSSNYYNKLIGSPFSLQGYPIFSKYMFELCYNLYCMNSIAGIIHGDLHLNNATINSILYKTTIDINNIENPNDLYVLGDENNQYIFKTSGYFLCIIDFSRSIILPEKINNFVDLTLPKTYKIINDIKGFQIEQVEKLLNLYLNYATDNESNKDELRILFKNSFEAVFKLLTSIDIYGITDKLLKMFKLNDNTIIKPHKNCIDLLEKMNTYSQEFLTLEMNKLISDKTYEKNILEMEWPLLLIIKHCFYENLINNVKIGDIINVFNYNNKLNYSLNKLDLFPPTIKTHKIIENNKEKIIPTGIFSNLRKKFETEKNNNMKVISYIASRTKQKHI